MQCNIPSFVFWELYNEFVNLFGLPFVLMRRKATLFCNSKSVFVYETISISVSSQFFTWEDRIVFVFTRCTVTLVTTNRAQATCNADQRLRITNKG